MNLPRKCTAINALFLLASWWAAAAHAQQAAGTVTHLSGPLVAKKADGTVKVLSQKSTVEQGDTLISEKDTYARIKFTDNSEITLRPNTQLKIDSFSFEEGKPEKDSAVFNLFKGGLRAITGMLGKRNNERFGVNTPAATIGIRGTIFIAEYVPPAAPDTVGFGAASLAWAAWASADNGYDVRTDAPTGITPTGMLPVKLAQNVQGLPAFGAASSTEGRSPGLYVQVLDGMINLRNSGGTQNFAAGQFGYTSSLTQPPVILPANPGIKFAPPPAFSSTTSMQSNAASPPQNAEVDCEVR